MKLCDIHTHVLPGVDHGARDMDAALQMLQNAVASDVEYVALTPHFDIVGLDPDAYIARMQTQFAALQEAAAGLPIRLAPGAEVHISRELLEQLDDLRLPTINGSRYLLTEFPFSYPESWFAPALEQLLMRDYIPLIAHPERYVAVCEAPWITEQWLDMGCHLQLTGSSILGQNGQLVRQAAVQLLQRDLVACVASDAHGVHERTNYLMGVYDHLSVHFSGAYAQCLLQSTPLRIWRDENL